MAQTFSRSSDRVLRLIVFAVLILAGGALVTAVVATRSALSGVGYQPTQPVPFSHRLHAGELSLDCTYCHHTVEKAAHAAIPTTESCLGCHVRIAASSPLLADVLESYSSRAPIEWVRVHRLPDYASFSHQAHVSVGVSCVACHGRVDEMEQVRQVEPLTMTWCLDCHRNPDANLRPREFVTDLDWVPDGDPAQLGRELRAERGINPPENCSACHR